MGPAHGCDFQVREVKREQVRHDATQAVKAKQQYSAIPSPIKDKKRSTRYCTPLSRSFPHRSVPRHALRQQLTFGTPMGWTQSAGTPDLATCLLRNTTSLGRPKGSCFSRGCCEAHLLSASSRSRSRPSTSQRDVGECLCRYASPFRVPSGSTPGSVSIQLPRASRASAIARPAASCFEPTRRVDAVAVAAGEGGWLVDDDDAVAEHVTAAVVRRQRRACCNNLPRGFGHTAKQGSRNKAKRLAFRKATVILFTHTCTLTPLAGHSPHNTYTQSRDLSRAIRDYVRCIRTIITCGNPGDDYLASPALSAVSQLFKSLAQTQTHT